MSPLYFKKFNFNLKNIYSSERFHTFSKCTQQKNKIVSKLESLKVTYACVQRNTNCKTQQNKTNKTFHKSDGSGGERFLTDLPISDSSLPKYVKKQQEKREVSTIWACFKC